MGKTFPARCRKLLLMSLWNTGGIIFHFLEQGATVKGDISDLITRSKLGCNGGCKHRALDYYSLLVFNMSYINGKIPQLLWRLCGDIEVKG
jgi:hypothetical protein